MIVTYKSQTRNLTARGSLGVAAQGRRPGADHLPCQAHTAIPSCAGGSGGTAQPRAAPKTLRKSRRCPEESRVIGRRAELTSSLSRRRLRELGNRSDSQAIDIGFTQAETRQPARAASWKCGSTTCGSHPSEVDIDLASSLQNGCQPRCRNAPEPAREIDVSGIVTNPQVAEPVHRERIRVPADKQETG
jgi:hypothetical protein